MPKRFHFPLQTLLRVRSLSEREAKRRVGVVLAEIGRLEATIDGLQNDIRARQTGLCQQQSGLTLQPDELARGRMWIVSLRMQIARAHQEAQQRRAELAQRQSELAEARKQTRVIEKLRERRYEAWRKNISRHEQSGSDETARQLLRLHTAETDFDDRATR